MCGFLFTIIALALAIVAIGGTWANGTFNHITIQRSPVTGRPLDSPLTIAVDGTVKLSLQETCITQPTTLARCLDYPEWNEKFSAAAVPLFGLRFAALFQLVGVIVGAVTTALLLLQIIRDCLAPQWWKRDIWFRFVAAILNIVMILLLLLSVFCFASSRPAKSDATIKAGLGIIFNVVAVFFLIAASVFNFMGHFRVQREEYREKYTSLCQHNESLCKNRTQSEGMPIVNDDQSCSISRSQGSSSRSEEGEWKTGKPSSEPLPKV